MTHQLVKLSNYDVVGMNEFEFTSLSVYNFRVSEETFGLLTQSQLKIDLEGYGA